MCLVTEFPEEVSWRDMTCYKVLEKHNTKYTSPFMGKTYKVPSEVEDDGEEDVEELHFDIKKTAVKGGFIHSFTSLYAALGLRNKFQQTIVSSDFVVVKCIIPKGTRFYESSSEYDICSKKIKLIEECV